MCVCVLFSWWVPLAGEGLGCVVFGALGRGEGSVAIFWFWRACWGRVSVLLCVLVAWCACVSMAVANDFSSLPMTQSSERATKRMKTGSGDMGEMRSYLRVFETLPVQCLNAYGEHKMSKMSEKALWEHFCKPLKSGACWMTELCDQTAERRGIGLNRWLLAVKEYCDMQRRAQRRSENEYIMKAELVADLYKEIDWIYPALEYCLAPKKVSERKGASAVRSSSRVTPADDVKPRAELEKHAKVLWEWLDTGKVSRVRMLMNYQCGGGQPYVAAMYHRGTQCFKYDGNLSHSSSSAVALEEFQAAIVARHSVGSSGVGGSEEAESVQLPNDLRSAVAANGGA